MRTATFSAQPLAALPHADTRAYRLEQLREADLAEYDIVYIVGSGKLDEASELPLDIAAKLWKYAENGGKLYAELIDAFDFPSSRLFGWKQDFPKTRRTLEKLRVASGRAALAEGQLLEWSGAMAHGFAFYADPWLEFGSYQSTHRDPGEGGGGYPALHVRKLGKGTVVFASFALYAGEQKEMLRPYDRWAALLSELERETSIPFAIWERPLRLSGGTDADAAVAANVRWFTRSGMLPASDGSEGVLENIHSVTGALSRDRRPDCHAHTALMFHLYGRRKQDERALRTADRLMDYLFDHGFQDMDPESPSYGFFKWFDYPGADPDQIFTDDNAWVCFVLLYLLRKTGREEYAKRGLPLAEALLRTQNGQGLRPNCVTRAQLEELGAEGVRQLPGSMNPHFESIAHAAFIQAYLVTQDRAYLDAAMKGTLHLLRNMDRLEFMYSRTSGLSRLLLPLGYLSKQEEGGEAAAGLSKVLGKLLSHLHPEGGIEEADNPDPERFGKEDSGVYIQNGEGIADQLYTNNFLLMNAWEAWKATGDADCLKLHESLASFLCRIQIASDDPAYDGGWMRAFDMNGRDYFGNNGDTGWGPYCMEGGWTNAVISAGLLLRQLDESIFE